MQSETDDGYRWILNSSLNVSTTDWFDHELVDLAAEGEMEFN